MATKVVTDSLVNDVIAGKYGNGAERQKKLSELNYDYKEVNAAVTAKLNEGNSSSSGSKPATQTSPAVTQPAVGNTGGSDVSIGQSSADAQLAEQMRQQQEAYDNLVAYQQEMYNESKKQAAANRENANRNAYISREIAVKNLPDQLAAQGINGGLSESSMVRLHNNYARTLAQNDLQYNDTVANAYRQMLANKADIESNRPTVSVPTVSAPSATKPSGGNKQEEEQEEDIRVDMTYEDIAADVAQMALSGRTNGEIQAYIKELYANGYLNTAEYNQLFKQYRR